MKKYLKIGGLFLNDNNGKGIAPQLAEGIICVAEDGKFSGVLVFSKGLKQKVNGEIKNSAIANFASLSNQPKTITFKDIAMIDGAEFGIKQIQIPQDIEYYQDIAFVTAEELKVLNFSSNLIDFKSAYGLAKHIGKDSNGFINNVLFVSEKSSQKDYEAGMNEFEQDIANTPAEYKSDMLETVYQKEAYGKDGKQTGKQKI